MNVNIIDFLVIQHEIDDLKQKIEILECHLNELGRGVDGIQACPFCGSPARTIGMMASNDKYYYKTMCSNRRCELEDIPNPNAYLYPNKEDSINFWNFFVEKLTKDE